MTEQVSALLSKYHQEHLLDHVDELSQCKRKQLFSQISGIDWSFLESYKKKPEYPGDIQPLGALTRKDYEKTGGISEDRTGEYPGR